MYDGHVPRAPSRRLGALLGATFLGASVFAVAAPAAAQSPEEIKIARETAREGLEAYRAAEYERALNLFEQARAVYPSAQIIRMLGYTQIGLGRWMQAVATLEAALASTVAPLGDADRKDVEEQLAKAMSHFGTVTVKSSVPGAELSVDGDAKQPLPLAKPLRLLEGKHRFVVTAPEREPRSEEVTVVGGKTVELALDPPEPKPDAPPPPKPKPKVPPPPPPREPLFDAQLGVGLAATGAGVALGAAALGTMLAGVDLRGRVEDDVSIHEEGYGVACEKADYSQCVYDRAIINRDASRADAFRDWSIGLGIGALVAAGAGVTLLVLDPRVTGSGDAPPRAGLSCALGATGASCRGRF